MAVFTGNKHKGKTQKERIQEITDQQHQYAEERKKVEGLMKKDFKRFISIYWRREHAEKNA